ncbi:hypothetical protein [Pedobacter sp. SL55]|uniref:hypothetical protein n=1 Tax=Pedobacter sp. SL55 TaxID=2995161 RepID=UPI0022704344|nr:hypothetical protein [Pedobacter sp. SL55]WAC40481.1 hypothetical protein OVA16_18225 [Pedobacter sp. SL55]
MGLNPLFQEDFFLTIQDRYRVVENIQAHPFNIVAVENSVYINLVSLNATILPQQLQSLQVACQQQGVLLVHLWEDVWLNKRGQVLSRIHSFCGKNISLHGRKTKVITIDTATAKAFLQAHHLQGYIKTKFNYGLSLNNELVAVACFAAARPMKSKGDDYRSAELVRFATKTGYTITGGLGKLVKHFLKQVSVNDLMTYADRDWSLGKGYDKLGFHFSGNTDPVTFYVDTNSMERYYAHRLPKKIALAFDEQKVLNLDDFLSQNGFSKVFNTGNLKYHLYTNV